MPPLWKYSTNCPTPSGTSLWPVAACLMMPFVLLILTRELLFASIWLDTGALERTGARGALWGCDERLRHGEQGPRCRAAHREARFTRTRRPLVGAGEKEGVRE